MSDSKTPKYYLGKTRKGKIIEADEVIEAFSLNFWTGNVLKYLLRAGQKTEDPSDDLRKAIHYLEKELAAWEAPFEEKEQEKKSGFAIQGREVQVGDRILAEGSWLTVLSILVRDADKVLTVTLSEGPPGIRSKAQTELQNNVYYDCCRKVG